MHYPDFDNYSNIKDLSATNESRIIEDKTLRESIAGKNHHKKQCKTTMNY